MSLSSTCHAIKQPCPSLEPCVSVCATACRLLWDVQKNVMPRYFKRLLWFAIRNQKKKHSPGWDRISYCWNTQSHSLSWPSQDPLPSSLCLNPPGSRDWSPDPETRRPDVVCPGQWLGWHNFAPTLANRTPPFCVFRTPVCCGCSCYCVVQIL